MERLLMFLTVVVMLGGCGFQEAPTMLLDPDDPSLVPYKQRYIASLKFVTGIDFSDAADEVQVSLSGELRSNELGRCSRYKSGDKTIGRIVRINSQAWPSMSEYAREQLIWHEMGHCMLEKNHENYLYESETDGKIPGSIMNSYHIGQSTYVANRAYYISQYVNTSPINANRALTPSMVAQLNIGEIGKPNVEASSGCSEVVILGFD